MTTNETTLKDASDSINMTNIESKNLILGLGQGGSNMAVELFQKLSGSDEKYNCFIMNTSLVDLHSIRDLSDDYKYAIDPFGSLKHGTGKKRGSVQEHSEETINDILFKSLKDRKPNPNNPFDGSLLNFRKMLLEGAIGNNNIYICSSLGGGTGSGLTPVMSSLLSTLKRKDIPGLTVDFFKGNPRYKDAWMNAKAYNVVTVAALSDISEGDNLFENNLNAIKEMDNMIRKSEKISFSVMLVQNLSSGHDATNSAMSDLLALYLKDTHETSMVLDREDRRQLFINSPGFHTITKINESGAIESNPVFYLPKDGESSKVSIGGMIRDNVPANEIYQYIDTAIGSIGLVRKSDSIGRIPGSGDSILHIADIPIKPLMEKLEKIVDDKRRGISNVTVEKDDSLMGVGDILGLIDK